jgi:hypothetical protein
VIAGTATIQFEGAIPQWTEAQITGIDGRRETVQSKSRAKGQWTIGRLRSDGVLAGLVAAEARGEGFRFVSDRPCELAPVAKHASAAEDDDDLWLADAEAVATQACFRSSPTRPAERSGRSARCCVGPHSRSWTPIRRRTAAASP